MAHKGFGTSGTSVAALVLLCVAPSAAGAQTARVAGWGSYEAVTRSQDWSTAGAQLALRSARGHGVWMAGEMFGRFGERDLTGRIGGVVHPGQRLWISAEAGSAAQPVFMPKNSWELDATALIAPRASVGVGYRRWNYAVGPVDIVIPHVTIEAQAVSWDLRVYSPGIRPSHRHRLALRATRSLSRRTAASLLGGAGRESYLVATGATTELRSIETVTGGAACATSRQRRDATNRRQRSISATTLGRGGVR